MVSDFLTIFLFLRVFPSHAIKFLYSMMYTRDIARKITKCKLQHCSDNKEIIVSAVVVCSLVPRQCT